MIFYRDYPKPKLKLYVIEKCHGTNLNQYWTFESIDEQLNFWEVLKESANINYRRHSIDNTDHIITCYDRGPVKTFYKRYTI